MASPPAGAQILYVFVQESREAGQERFKHCFPYISNPGDKVKALCRAVQVRRWLEQDVRKLPLSNADSCKCPFVIVMHVLGF